MELTDRRWGKFAVGDLFRLEQGKGKGANHLEQDPEGISYLGATNRNNAVLGFVKPEPSLVQEGNCIAFIRNGEGSMGYAVYKAEDFIATSDITLGYSPFLNKYTGMFITTCADMVRGKYSYNYKRSDTRLKQEMVQLPIDEAGNPDWAFMEAYMREREQKLIREYIAHVKSRLRPAESLTLECRKWGEFVIGELFRIESGRCSNAGSLEHDDAGVPYVGATNRNNGVLDFVKPVDELIMKGNCIAFVKQGEGSVGYAVYKHEDFIAATSIAAGYAPFLNKYTGMFITTVADKVRGKYNYNYPRSESRLRKEVIQLPVDETGQPDWDFMTQYMQAAEYRLYLHYLEAKLQGDSSR